MDLLADTVLLIDLWRETKKPGPAMRFAMAHSGHAIGISWVVLGEFLCGSVLAEQGSAAAEMFVGRYPVIHSNEAMVKRYADLHAMLKRQSQLISSNDLWIAACALQLDLPLVTRNRREFDRIPDLHVIDYTRD